MSNKRQRKKQGNLPRSTTQMIERFNHVSATGISTAEALNNLRLGMVRLGISFDRLKTNL